MGAAIVARKEPAIAQVAVDGGHLHHRRPPEVEQQRRDLRRQAQALGVREPEQRLLAVAIARGREQATGFVQQAEGPHAIGLVQGRDPAIGQQGQQDLRVAIGLETAASTGEHVPQRAEVVDLAVVGQRVSAAVERLRGALARVEDGQPRVADEAPGPGGARWGDGRQREEMLAGAIRAAVAQGGKGLPRARGIDRLVAFYRNEKSTHGGGGEK